jgi:hypothetical protein
MDNRLRDLEREITNMKLQQLENKILEEECYEQPKDEVEPDDVSGWVVVELDLSLVAL